MKYIGKFINKEKGFTLIECIISITLISIIIISTSALFSFTLNNYKHHIKHLETKHNSYLVLKYIEKRLREFNQKCIVFDSQNNIFQGRKYNDDIVYVDLSGKRSYKTNTMIYFYKPRGEIRVSKKGEHNVLCNGIEDIIVNELISGKLIEIKVITDNGNYHSKIKLNLNYNLID